MDDRYWFLLFIFWLGLDVIFRAIEIWGVHITLTEGCLWMSGVCVGIVVGIIIGVVEAQKIKKIMGGEVFQ